MEFNDIIIEGTLKSPKIEFSLSTGELILSGRSFPENAAQVYEPLLFWIDNYIKSPQQTTNLYLKLEYFNSSSLLWIVRIVKTLSKIDQKDSFFFIHLYFDEDDFDIREADNLRDVISSLVKYTGELKVTIGIKTHGTDKDGKTVTDTTILI
jgi:hypothetical protein